MARTRRTVEVRITAVSLLFSYSTNISETMSIGYPEYHYAQDSSRITVRHSVILTLNIIITKFSFDS